MNEVTSRSVPTALLTDLYQLTMAAGYWSQGMADRESVFHLTFRKSPFGGGYALAAGLESAIRWLDEFHFSPRDLEYLATLTGADNKRLFSPDFLSYLSSMTFSCDVDAIKEGTVVFANEPLLRVRGPLIQAQLIETGLLNLVNFETLVATKASRISRAAGGDAVLEFGLRRAQGIDGGLAASRAAYVGGCDATSNVWAGQEFGIPVKGTHAHSWVMSFDSELAAFESYAEAMPNNCVLLVDTYSTIDGIRNAIRVGQSLHEKGADLLGIRLDSGDLVELSVAARQMLDDAGMNQVKVVASNDLDEHEITRLKRAGAQIDVWGVGTRLATCYDQPALGGVYKLSAIVNQQGAWENRVKLSDEPIKVSLPGVLQVRRFRRGGFPVADVIFDERLGTSGSVAWSNSSIVDEPLLDEIVEHEDLLIPIYREGERVSTSHPDVHSIKQRAKEQLASMPEAILRLDEPDEYAVGIDEPVYAERERLVGASEVNVGRS